MSNTARYFKDAEFKRCVPSCSIDDMQQHTLNRLDTARFIAGVPFVLTSAYRSVAWEKAKGRTGDGAHTTGEAVDIKTPDLASRYKILFGLIKAGFNRIGIADGYIHADDCPRKTKEVVWLYK